VSVNTGVADNNQSMSRGTVNNNKSTSASGNRGDNEGGGGGNGNGNQSKTRYVATTITSPRLSMDFSTTHSGCKGMISFNVCIVYVLCMVDTQL